MKIYIPYLFTALFGFIVFFADNSTPLQIGIIGDQTTYAFLPTVYTSASTEGWGNVPFVAFYNPAYQGGNIAIETIPFDRIKRISFQR